MKKILLIFLIAGLIFFISYVISLPVFTLEKQGQIIFLHYVKPGDTFLLGYLHSVAQTDVWEEFSIDKNYQIILTQTMFQGQGAGLPYNITEHEKLIRDGEWFRIMGMRRVVPMINWRIDTQWQSRFRFGQEKIIPAAKVWGDGVVQIKAGQMKLKNWLIYGLKNFWQRNSGKNERY